MDALAPALRTLAERAATQPMLAQVEQWAAVNSGTGNLTGLATMAELLADAFAALPGDVSLHDPAPASTVRADGTVEPIALGQNLVVRVRPDASRRILLTGHMDTVYAADHPFQTCRWIDGERLNGPGTADMKGGLAVMLAALRAWEGEADADRIGYDVLVNSDEEIGSPGSAALIAQLAAGKHAALTYEPALADGTLAGARPGSGNWSLVVRGRAAHAGRNPDDGRNALVAAADLALRLAGARQPGLSVNPARIDGGAPNNMVPDLAILRVNMRPAGPDEAARALAAVEAAVAGVGAEHEVVVERHGGFGRPPKPVDQAAERLFDLVAACGRGLGLTIERRDTGGVCDGNNIAAAGVPVVDTMGPRGGAIHSPDEFLRVPSLAERAALSALVLRRLAGGEL